MTLNQLEFGNDKVEFERFNLTELIGGVLQSMDILSQQKDVKLIFREENPVYVWGGMSLRLNRSCVIMKVMPIIMSMKKRLLK